MLTKDQISSFFDSVKTNKVLIVGDVMVDAYIWGRVERISPEAPVPVVTVSHRANMLGGAANVARNIKAMGAEPLLCSVVGDDQKGGEFLQLLIEESISSEGILCSKKRKTTVKFRVIGNNHQLIRVDEEDDKDLDQEEVSELLYRFEGLLNKNRFQVIIFQDYNKGVLTGQVIDRIISKAHGRGIPVAVDPKKRHFDAYCNIDLFKPNLKELIEGSKLDMPPQNMDDLKSVIITFQKQQNIDNMLVTLSEKGIYISSKEGDTCIAHHIPAHLRTIADVSGAGDTVISVASLCLASQMPPFDMAAISNLAGGLVCEHVGVVPIKRERLIKEVLGLYMID